MKDKILWALFVVLQIISVFVSGISWEKYREAQRLIAEIDRFAVWQSTTEMSEEHLSEMERQVGHSMREP